jgi:hypothetical protein
VLKSGVVVMAALVRRADLLRLIDEEQAWLEFLIHTKWFNNKPAQSSLRRNMQNMELTRAQNYARVLIRDEVPTNDLLDMVIKVWEEYPAWWIKKYGH